MLHRFPKRSPRKTSPRAKTRDSRSLVIIFPSPGDESTTLSCPGHQAEEHPPQGAGGLPERGGTPQTHVSPQHRRIRQLLLVQELPVHHHGVLRRRRPWRQGQRSEGESITHNRSRRWRAKHEKGGGGGKSTPQAFHSFALLAARPVRK